MSPAKCNIIIAGHTHNMHSPIAVFVASDAFQNNIGCIRFLDFKKFRVLSTPPEGEGEGGLADFAVNGLPGVGHAVLSVA